MRYMNLLLPLLTVLVFALPVWAQSNNPYELTWLAFGSSSTTSGGQYQVSASLGQLDNQQLTGGAYALVGRLGSGSAVTITPTSMPVPATTNPTPVATPTPVTGEMATPMPPPPSKLYLPVVKR